MFRVMGSVDVPRTGFVVAANLQHFSGKPWAATAQMSRCRRAISSAILLEPRGTRRLSSQSLLDVRVSRTIAVRRQWDASSCCWTCSTRSNDTAEEGLATDNLFSPNFGQPTVVRGSRAAR